MLIKSHLAAAIVGSAITYYVFAMPLRKKADANKFASLLTLDVVAAQKKQIEYLAHLIEENDVELTEFDLIALNNMNQD